MLEKCTEKSQLIVEVGKEVGWSKLLDSGGGEGGGMVEAVG